MLRDGTMTSSATCLNGSPPYSQHSAFYCSSADEENRRHYPTLVESVGYSKGVDVLCSI